MIKSTCYKSFTIRCKLSETTMQLMERIEAQEGLRAADLLLMNLSGKGSSELTAEKTLEEQGVENESVLALDVKTGSDYKLGIRVSDTEVIEL